MKRICLFLLLILIVASCKQEKSLEPPTTTPPIVVPPVVTPKDNYLLSTVSVRYDAGKGKDSVRFVYNDKNQVTDSYVGEGAAAYFLYSHSRFRYNDAGKVIRAEQYVYPALYKPENLVFIDSLKWTSASEMLSYGIHVDNTAIVPIVTTRLNGNGQINYFDNLALDYLEKYEYQNKDISKLITIDRTGKETLTTYEYNDKLNPFYQVFVQNPFFYDITFYISSYCSFSEHNATKIIGPKSRTDIRYKVDPVTGLVSEQEKTETYSDGYQYTTTSTFSYIKAK